MAATVVLIRLNWNRGVFEAQTRHPLCCPVLSMGILSCADLQEGVANPTPVDRMTFTDEALFRSA